MDHELWHARWREGRIGFHEGVVNDLLAAHFERLGLAKGAHVFVPLCGMAEDIDWLLAQGMWVSGAELDEGAVRGLFERLGAVPEVQEMGALKRYSGPGVTIYVGDIFALEALNGVDAIYDRAALIALPPELRGEYAAHLRGLTGGAAQLAITIDYDQGKMAGPPFSVPEAELAGHYAGHYRIERLARREITGALAGRVSGWEEAWLLQP